MDIHTVLAVVVLLANCINSQSVPAYVISAPSQVRPLTTYTVFASLHNANSPMNIKLTISSNTGENVIGQASVSPGSSSDIKIQIGDWTGVNTMLVEGTGAISFNYSTSIDFNSKKCSVFIQTDKAIYQPSQTAKFRVFVINSELLPYASDITIYITDPQDNRIKQYLNSTLDKGVFSSELQLSDQPILGDWKIKATVGSIETTKIFTVQEYVLPTFEVTLSTPTFALFKDTALPIRVEAKYTFGKPVSGNVVLYVSDSCYEQKTNTECLSRPNISATLDKKGQVVIQLDVSTIRYPSQIYNSQSTLNFVAVVTEDLTGNTANDTGSMNLYPYKEKLSISASPDKFRPGLPLYVTAILSDQDNVPIISPDAPINFSITYQSAQTITENRLVPVSTNGIVLELNPLAGTTSMTAQASYKAVSSTNLYISVQQSLSNNYILLELNTEKPLTAGDVATFRIRSTFSITQLLYEVVSSGEIVASGLLSFPATTDYNFVITTTHDMTPQSHIVVYVVDSKNEILADSIDFNVDGFFLTPVKLSVNPNETEPGKPVEVVVDTNPSAMVFLVGTDQSVLLLKSGNDITKQEVEQDYALYDGSNTPPTPSGFEEFPFFRRSIEDTPGIFLNAGIYLITNAAYYRQPIRHFGPGLPCRALDCVLEENVFEFAAPENGAEEAFPAATEISQPGIENPSTIRQYFPESWIWIDLPARISRTITKFQYNSRIPIISSISRNPVGRPVEFLCRALGCGGEVFKSAGPEEVFPDVTEISKPGIENPSTRQYFPESWIWIDLPARPDGKAVFNATTPDTITSWIISAAVMDYKTGFGLGDSTAKVTVIKPFFVSLNLPYSIVRGETLNLQALIFNYMKEGVQTNVTISNENGEYEFTDEPKNALSQSKTVTVPSGETVSVVFPIVSKIVGYVKIKISAIAVSPVVAGDIIQKELLSKAEGTTKYFNRAELIDLRQTKTFSLSVEINVPKDMVPDSKRVQVSVIGDIMGPTFNNIDSLLREPYGCGEQNMINFVPNIVVADYLSSIGELTEERKNKAVSNMASGYQRELTYKHRDGSYSAFGDSDPNGSTWLTSYVLKSFVQAKKYIVISDSIINEGLQFLSSTQAPDGTFVENGNVIHKDLQGGITTSGLSMTAYICTSFLIIGNPTYQTTATKCIAAIEKRLPNAIDPYEVAILTYALHLGGSSMKDKAFNKLQGLATKEGGLIYWKKLTNETGSVVTTPTYETDSTNSLNVEATSYSLLTYAFRNQYGDAIPIVRWLVSQRNEFGAFASTQDTVIGLEALSKIVQSNGIVNINCIYGGTTKSFTVTNENKLLLQQETLPPETQVIKFDATGNGSAMVQVTWSYNIATINYLGKFSINATVDSQTQYSYQLTVCAVYITSYGDSSGMAIIELNTLSGYTFVKQDKLVGTNKRIEYALDNTRINLYYYKIDSTATCATVTATKNNEVYNLKEAEVKVYDYYKQGNKAKCGYLIKP